MTCCGHLGMAGTRLPFSSMKCPPALSTQRWWRDIRACRAVVGVSFPSWVSAFFSGENSSSRSTSYTTNVLLETQSIPSAHRQTEDLHHNRAAARDWKISRLISYSTGNSTATNKNKKCHFSFYAWSGFRLCVTSVERYKNSSHTKDSPEEHIKMLLQRTEIS